ncbi:MAG TPA: lipid-A-disaccharide synthase [Bryobacteraceae bacterium]|nr:lipid-A-disaccharide synthase [Bryobacteraceae bacterium]
MQPAKVFVSAGESSGDMYAAALIEALQKDWSGVDWFGCAGPRMQLAGVRTVVDARSLSVVGLVEVLVHLPRIYGEFRKLVRCIRRERPDFVILTDSPDFHLRLAKKVHAMGIPVIYLVAPQAWAWRQGRLKQMRLTIKRLLCLFPFEEKFYRDRGVAADYIGHPLAQTIRAKLGRAEFFAKHGISTGQPLIALCPGSRRGEIGRHLPPLIDAVERIRREIGATFVLAAPLGFREKSGDAFFRERISGSTIQLIEGETWDVLSHANLALTASGTVTMEAALLGTPMITYYRVAPVSWLLGCFLVRVPFYSMVNLIAGKRLAPELMQNEMTGERLARETVRLLKDATAREAMREGLKEVRRKLSVAGDPMERAAGIVREYFDEYTRQT